MIKLEEFCSMPFGSTFVSILALYFFSNLGSPSTFILLNDQKFDYFGPPLNVGHGFLPKMAFISGTLYTLLWC